MEVKSEWVPVAVAAGRLYDYVSNFANLKVVLPEQVRNFSATEDECSFEVNGVAKVRLRMTERVCPTRVALGTVAGESPVPVGLVLEMAPEGEAACKARVTVTADVPFMLSGMVKKPLEKFVGELSRQLQQFTGEFHGA